MTPDAIKIIESDKTIINIIRNALKEDIGDGDITTESIINSDAMLRGKIIAKENGIIAGLEIAKSAFSQIDEDLIFEQYVEDGEYIISNTELAQILGNGQAILSSERLVLNLIQRMAGIATLTRKYVDRVKGTKAKILDTRKTAPGLRILDKQAVKLGGGENHRFGLYDMFLVKENHITAAGSIAQAVDKIISGNKEDLLIEVEVKNATELKEALALKIDRILLDNMTMNELHNAVDLSNGKIPLEASGNVNLNNVRAIAETGVDFISVGMLTHSVKALDISLIIENANNH